MKNILKILIILAILVQTNCTDIPDDLIEEASLKGCDSVFDNATHFCYDGKVYARCGSVRYNPTTHICQGSVADPARCNGVQYNPLEKGCCGSTEFRLAEDKRCQSGVVETKCGSDWYNASSNNLDCQSNVVVTKCGTGWYDAVNQRCQGNVVQTKCGSDWYNASNSNLRCQSNVVETKCESDWYNVSSANLRCQGGVVETKCGNYWYNAANQRCGANNVVEAKCGTAWYNTANQRCGTNYVVETKCGTSWYDAADANFRCENGVEAKCGTVWYNTSNQRCGENNVVETRCGATGWYNATSANLRCQSGVIEIKCGTGSTYHNPATEQCCGNSKYTVATQFCSDTQAYNLCGGEEYDPANQRCQSNVVETKCGTGSTYHNPATEQCCGNNKYVTATQFCSDNFVLGKCGGEEYDHSTQYCVDGIVSTSKGEFTDSRNGKTYEYVTIGTQTWMAENLDYATESGSACYGNTDSRCDQYGRLYNWAAAMNFAEACNTNLVSSADCGETIGTPHQGICPAGWHLPTPAEWNILRYFIGSSVNARHLKSQEGWSSCGPSGSGKSYSCEDTYGFAALPGGSGYSGGSFSYVGNLGILGFWWTASENNSSDAYNLRMSNSSEDAYWYYHDYDKSGLRSVRCLKD